jgi:hypothetical protein
MDFHLVKLNFKGTYLSIVDPKSKPRFVCFAEKETAKNYINYAAEFRAKNRIWPCMDMTSEFRKLEAKNVPYGRPEQIKRYLDIESFDIGTLDKLACKTNISFYCILKFDVTYNGPNETLSFSGQELDGVADPIEFGKWMDLSLKIT